MARKTAMVPNGTSGTELKDVALIFMTSVKPALSLPVES